MMLSRLAVIVFFILFYTGYGTCGDTYYNFGGGNTQQQGGHHNQQGGQGNTQKEYKYTVDGYANRHSDYWCSVYKYAVNYAKEGKYNTAIAICNEVIRRGDDIHRSKCAALESQIVNILYR